MPPAPTRSEQARTMRSCWRRTFCINSSPSSSSRPLPALIPGRGFCLYDVIWLLLLFFFQIHSAASTNDHVLLITIDGLAASYLSDPQARLPTLRGLATNGAVAEALHVSNPTITWPNHTTLITGVSPAKHSVLFNGLLVRPGPGLPVRIDGRRDQAELVAVPTVYDLLSRAGYRTANINWPCTRNSKTLDNHFPDVLEHI